MSVVNKVNIYHIEENGVALLVGLSILLLIIMVFAFILTTVVVAEVNIERLDSSTERTLAKIGIIIGVALFLSIILLSMGLTGVKEVQKKEL